MISARIADSQAKVDENDEFDVKKTMSGEIAVDIKLFRNWLI